MRLETFHSDQGVKDELPQFFAFKNQGFFERAFSNLPKDDKRSSRTVVDILLINLYC